MKMVLQSLYYSKTKLDNLIDSKAIAFKCQIADEWQTIGYIVREALDPVHIYGNT